jgi:hypothetical protein
MCCRTEPGERSSVVARAVSTLGLLGRLVSDSFSCMSAEKLKTRLPDDHPAVLAALRAPIESETDEEHEAVEAALNSGQLVPGTIVTAEIARRARRTHG